MTDHNLFTILPYKGQLIKLERATSAVAYYRHYAIDLLSGEKFPFDFMEWIKVNQQHYLSTEVLNPRVIHLFYELGFLIEEEFQLLSEDALLAIDISFLSFQKIEIEEVEKVQLDLISYPDFAEYKKSFDTGYQELLKGNCYQFNLTFPFIYSFPENFKSQDFIFSLWAKEESRGAFGSATYIPYFDQLFLSNSPECLFQIKKNILSTMPIKGTLLRKKNESWKPLWRQMVNDKKSQAELYMISDLLRNDLSRIEFPKATVVKKRFPKLVPGLLHQYSQIDVELSASVSLWRVIEKIFPGGSITGAPKLRAIRLLAQLEDRPRGFYCGSTIILFKEMKSASINIRSAVLDLEEQTLLYQAGGGITLLSDAQEEFKEMTYKHDSFIRALTL